MFYIFHPFSRVVLHSAISPSPSLLKRGLAQKNDIFKIGLLIRPPPFRIIPQKPLNLSKCYARLCKKSNLNKGRNNYADFV